MDSEIKRGDLVLSLAGRDKGRIFLALDAKGRYARIADGRSRKVRSLKKKNNKHLKLVKAGVLPELARKILGGECVGDKTLRRAIAEQLKKQEE